MRLMFSGPVPTEGLVTVKVGKSPARTIPSPPRIAAPRQGPQSALRITASADALRAAGQFAEAIAQFDKAIAIDPDSVAAWYGRAMAHDASGALADAETDYRRVTALAPRAAAGFSGLASMLARDGRLEEARAQAERAVLLGPREIATSIALARCDLLAGDPASAAARLRAVRTDIPGPETITALTLLGDALDRIDNPREAFGAYMAAKRHFTQLYASPRPTALSVVDAMVDAVKSLDRARTGRWQGKAGPATGHVFLLGFPRSGTTLVEQVLGTIDGVVTLEEEPTLGLAADHFFSADGVAELDALSAAQLDALRADYWQRVAAAGADVEGKTFVDMDPFKAPFLPLIARLFPDARIVLMRRDPRDVVLSCLRQPFAYSPATYELASPERAARYFDAVMRLTTACQDRFALDLHELRYEDLVADFDGVTASLCDFLGLAWSDRMRDFASRARAARIKTVSAAQVRKPLYNGAGQWRRYAEQLRPALPLLERWL